MTIDAAQKPTRVRYLMLAMMFFTVVINYLDRNNISTTVSAIKGEFHIDNAEMGLILGAFGWTYALFQIPGGWLVDKMSPRILLPIILILWSLATISTSLASTVFAFFAIRLMVGLLEAPAYSIFNQVTTSWFPTRERATAVGVFISAQFLGPAFITGLLVFMVHAYGWRSVFYVTGGAGLVWGVIWYLVYRGPRESRLANAAELAEIELLLPLRGTPIRREIDDASAAQNVELKPLIELDGLRTIASLTFDGHGPSILPATMLSPHLQSNFVAVHIDAIPKRRVVLANRRFGFPAAPVRAIESLLFEVVRNVPSAPDGVYIPRSGSAIVVR